MFRRSILLCSGAAAVTASASHNTESSCSSSSTHRAEAVPPMPVQLKPSSSAARKPSFYFPRMRDDTSPSYVFQPTRLGTALPLFNITSSSCEYYALRLPLLKAGFRRVPSTLYDVPSNLLWGRSMPFREMLRTGSVAAPVQPTSAAALNFPAVSTAEQAAYLERLTMVNEHQRFNHFPLSHANVGCKRGMAVNVRAAQQQEEAAATTPAERAAVQSRYSFMPRTWLYPKEKESLVAAMKAAPSSMHFIWKPARGSCGRGILISDGGARNAPSWERVMRQIEAKAASGEHGRLSRNYVVQEYIDDPFLVEGRKMDLRLYVAVTSYNPLTVYWHEEGLVRLAAESYADATTESGRHIDISPTSSAEKDADRLFLDTAADGSVRPPRDLLSKQMHDRFRHLTNYSVGRKYTAVQEAAAASRTASAAGDVAVEGVTPAPELKWPLQRLWDYIDAQQASSATALRQRRPSDDVRESIAQLITRTLMAVRPVIDAAAARVPMPGGYFELYGFDVMLDRQLRPFLIEVNTLPSLESSSSFDYTTKTNVVADLLNVAMIEPFERAVTPESPLWHSSVLQEELQQPLTTAERALVHKRSAASSSMKGGVSTPPSRPTISREEVQLRLRDELAYARGFQRIFPAKPMPGSCRDSGKEDSATASALMDSLGSVQNTLDSLGSRLSYLEDLRSYERNKMLSQQDIWALES